MASGAVHFTGNLTNNIRIYKLIRMESKSVLCVIKNVQFVSDFTLRPGWLSIHCPQ